MFQDLKLLLVEDEPMQRTVMQTILTKSGYTVEAARDGAEAFQRLSSGEFQIVLTDLEMPGIDGLTLCRMIREAQLPAYVYVLLLTSHGSTANVVEALDAGADDFIRKPADPSELLARINAGKRIIHLEQSLREANAEILRLSFTDALTGVYNRRHLDSELLKEIAKAQRYDHALSVCMIDLDHFKAVNDRYGHPVGDEVLQGFVARALTLLRTSSDWVARYGGEEFVVVLPATTLCGAIRVAEKIRLAFSDTPITTSAGDLSITASLGVASLGPTANNKPEDANNLLRAADVALYRSKHAGRNLVSSHYCANLSEDAE